MEIRSKIEKLFTNVAKFVSENPWKTIFFAISFHVILALCLLSLHLNNDIKDLYTPRRSDTTRNEDELLPLYPDLSAHDFDPLRAVKRPLYAEVIFNLPDSHTDNLAKEDIRTAVDFIRSISIDIGYTKMADLTNFCAQKNNKCVIAGTDISYLAADGYELVALDDDYDKELVSGKVVKIRFYLRQEIERLHDESLRWLDTFVRVMTEQQQHINVSHVVSHSESFLEEIDNDTYPDIPYVSFMFTVFITYYGFLTSGGDCVTKRAHIGRMGVVTVGLSIMGSWGLLSGYGKSFTNMVGIMPYFALFFEVNMVLELLSAVGDNVDEKGAILRVTKAVREKSVTCTIVLLAHVIPYCTVLYSSYRAMMTFALYTILTLIFIFVTHFTFFVACLAIHERRINANRHCCTCRVIHSNDNPEVQERSGCFRCCCTGRQPSSRKQLESCFERLARKLFSKSVLVMPLKVAFLLVFLGYLGNAAWKSYSTNLDVIPEDSIASASYYSDFYDINNRYFRSQPPFMFVSNDPIDVNDEAKLQYYLKIFNDIKGLSNMNEANSSFWLFDYYTNYTMNGSSTLGQLSSRNIQEFISNNPQYSHDIVWGPDNSTIISLRFYVHSEPITSSRSAILIRRDVDKFVKHVEDDCQLTVHSPSLWLLDSYRSPLFETIRFVCAQVAVTVLLFIVFGNHVLSVVHVIAWHFSFIIGLLGGLVIFDVSINSISMIMIMLGSGYNMEVLIYTLSKYLHSEGINQTARTFNVLQSTTPILFNTTFGMFCGLMVLFVQKSYVFITALKVLATSTLLACLHATVFIPVVLSVIGAGRALYFKHGNQADGMQVWSTIHKSKADTNMPNGKGIEKEHLGYSNLGFVAEHTCEGGTRL